MRPLEIGLLGPVEVTRDGGVIRIDSEKQRALVAFLALRAGDRAATDEIVDGLWFSPPRSARKLVHTYVSRLRHALGDSKTALVTEGQGYRLRIERELVDAARFAELVELADRELAAGAPVSAAARCVEALSLWRGTPLADVGDTPFAAPERLRLEELRLRALEQRFEAALQEGAGGELVPELEALAAAHPTRERLRGLLMRALYRAGRQARALDVYREARRLLEGELGLEPGPELRRLERAILVQDPSLDARALRAERLPPTALVGRDLHIAELADLATRPGVRIVTVTGPGGIGKTSLALAVASRVQSRFRDAAVVVALGNVTEPDRVESAIADALGLTPEPGESHEDALLRGLSGLDLLVVLDSFEQVLAAAPVVSGIVERAPTVTVLATSRSVLRVAGEREFVVPPLDLEASVALFLERASSLDLTDDTTAAVRSICARLDGLPLALELAAARTKLLPPQEMLARLERRLDLLGGGRRDAPTRQQTLRATIDWSYALLASDEQRLFASLGAFVGGATLDAVEAVCDEGTQTLDSLASLVEKSLVVASAGRLSMLELVRDYALERLGAAEEAAVVRRRHAEYFCNLAERADSRLVGPEQDGWLTRLKAEHDNFRAALAWSLAAADAELALRLAAALARFWYVRGHLAEGRSWLGQAMSCSGDDAPAPRAKALYRAAELAVRQGDAAEAAELGEQALDLYRELRDPTGTAQTLMHLAHLAANAGDFGRAEARLAEAEALWEGMREPRQLAVLRANRAFVALLNGDVAAARALSHESASLASQAQDKHALSDAALKLGLVAIATDDAGTAREEFASAVAVAAEMGHSELVVYGLEGLALACAGGNEPERAAELLGGAEAGASAIGMTLDPYEQQLHQRAVELVASSLPPEAVERAWNRGRAMWPEEAIAAAIACGSQPARTT